MKRFTVYQVLGFSCGVWLVCATASVGWAEPESQTGSTDTSQPQATEQPASSGETAPAAAETSSSSSESTPPAASGAEQAAQPASEPPASSDAAAPAGASAPAPAAAAQPSSGLVSVDFKDADIRQVLRVISLKSGVDIVAGTDVEGLVTIKLTNVPWEQALDIILKTYGFSYDRKGNIVRVMTADALEKEALSTGVFPLNYAKSKDVPDVVKEMLSDRGRVKFDERTNTVIVTDISANLFQIEQVIKRLDQRTPQTLIETKVVETKLTKSEKLGIDWSDSLAMTASGASMPSTFPFIGGSKLGSFGSSFVPRAGTFSPSDGAALTRGRVPERGGTFTFGTLSPSSFAMTLNFLQSRTDTHIVSNPTISALNNQEAKIHIGEEYPIPNFSVDPSTGRTTITGYTPKAIGTVLTVTPHVNDSHEIVVELKPEVITASANVTFDTGGGSSVSLPRFTIQTAQTQVRIRNQDTIAIGGLVKRSDAKTEEKVPVLGDIPLVGLLFKSVSRDTAAGSSDPALQDLLIFLTVKLTDEPSPETAPAVVAASPPAATP